MNESELTTEDVRQRLGQKTDRRGYRVFTKEAEKAAVAFALRRLELGGRAEQIATELGLNGWTLQRWLQRHRRLAVDGGGRGFRKVEVVAKGVGQIVIYARCGVRIEGLGLDDTVEVLRKLSCLA